MRYAIAAMVTTHFERLLWWARTALTWNGVRSSSDSTSQFSFSFCEIIAEDVVESEWALKIYSCSHCKAAGLSVWFGA